MTTITELCPLCGNAMVLRHRRQDGLPFMGCSRFPGCRGVRQFALGKAPPAILPRGDGDRPIGFWDTPEYRAHQARQRQRRPDQSNSTGRSPLARLRSFLSSIFVLER